MTTQNKGLLFLFFTSVLFSSNILVAKYAVGIVPPFTLAFLRWLVAFLILAVLFNGQIKSQLSILKTEWPHYLLLGFTGMFICGGFVYQAALTTSGTNIALIYALSPVLIIVFSAMLFKQKMSPLQYVGLLIAIVGVLIIIFKGSVDTLLNITFTVGDLWVLAACISWSVYSLKLSHWQSQASGMVRLAFISLFGALTLLPISVAEHFYYEVDYSILVVAMIMVVAVFPSLLAYRFYERSQQLLGANKAGLVLYLTPVVSGFLLYLLLDEQLAMFHFIGGTIALFGVYLTSRQRKKCA